MEQVSRLVDTTAAPARVRPDSRRRDILDLAAGLFARHGYEGTSVRDIAGAVGLQPSSLYHFFPGKDALLAEIYREGVERITKAVMGAIAASGGDPWARFENAAIAHLESLLGEGGNDYVRVVTGAAPKRDAALLERLKPFRESYEAIFRDLIAALPLRPEVDPQIFRLAALGMLNWSTAWYRSDRLSPREIARRMMRLLRANAVMGER